MKGRRTKNKEGDDDDRSQGRSYPRTVSNAYGFVKDSSAIFMYEVILCNPNV